MQSFGASHAKSAETVCCAQACTSGSRGCGGPHTYQLLAVAELRRDAVAQGVDDYRLVFCSLAIPVLREQGRPLSAHANAVQVPTTWSKASLYSARTSSRL